MTAHQPAGQLVVLSDEVRDALASGRPVVALESSLIAQGLPAPHNLETAIAAEEAVRTAGAVPATVAIADGQVHAGAGAELLERLADPSQPTAKAASRDLGPLLASGALASTTVSATMRVARWVGIELFATGGIGGVHRGAAETFDVSSDIDELAAIRVAVVSSGVKSILDVAATLELLETRRVPVVGLGTAELPAFLATSSGLRLPHTVANAAEAARLIGAHFAIPGNGGLLLVQAPPPAVAIPPDELEAWTSAAVQAAQTDGITGSGVTPYVLAKLADLSGGRTLRANIGLIVNNASIAADIAVARAERKGA